MISKVSDQDVNRNILLIKSFRHQPKICGDCLERALLLQVKDSSLGNFTLQISIISNLSINCLKLVFIEVDCPGGHLSIKLF